MSVSEQLKVVSISKTEEILEPNMAKPGIPLEVPHPRQIPEIPNPIPERAPTPATPPIPTEPVKVPGAPVPA
jgi:hypothetical protein